MTDAELLKLNEEGLIPGPGEREGDFLKRVGEVRGIYDGGQWISRWDWDGMEERVKELFDFRPKFLPAFYSNEGLRVWEGAACWIEGRKVCGVQLREGLRKGSYLGLYERGEILAHEAVHAARSGFEEQKCEEFFAYMTSEKRWRRVLGPILQRPWEVWPLLLSLLAGIFVEVGFGVAAVWLGLGFWRLIGQHLRLRRYVKRALHLVRDAKKVRAILFRLTDEEVARFAGGEDILEYAQRQKCLRWRVIRLAYLKGEDYGTESGD
ncbi:MAG TPA: hypothetical protein VLE89_05280 [Chlamydiales bacterium]|nr:hypothetical protein [Chlamydiales bacterium]